MNKLDTTLSLFLLLTVIILGCADTACAGTNTIPQTVANENAVQQAINDANSRSQPPPPPPPPQNPSGPPP
ncbi:hypothetical protein KBI23_21610 [bacterium]|nr:hypothetical protein [bacterium]MBP9810981.1 hypothetical protein [bacterium]